MKDCILCSTELKLMNSPTFGAGKLSGGEQVCTACFRKINNINPGIAFKLKKHSLSEIQNLLNEQAVEDSQVEARMAEIRLELQNLNLDNVTSFYGRKEINELPKILGADEHIDHIVQGTYNTGQGILISTDRRLVFIDKGLVYGLKVEDFPLDKISSIQYETGLVLGKVKVHTSGNVATIENVEKTAARKFSEFVRNKLSQPKEEKTLQHSAPNEDGLFIYRMPSVSGSSLSPENPCKILFYFL